MGEARIFNAIVPFLRKYEPRAGIWSCGRWGLAGFSRRRGGTGASQEAEQVFCHCRPLRACFAGYADVRYESARPTAPPRAVLEEIVQGLSYVRGSQSFGL